MQRYLIGLGSNIRHQRFGAPERVLEAALARLAQEVALITAAPILRSAPLGPSRRTYANTAAMVESTSPPETVLDLLQTIEHEFGRRRRGQRWGARVLDLDMLLWSGGCWASDTLTLPHPELRGRDFVLRPAAKIAPFWRDPHTNRTLRQLCARHSGPTPVQFRQNPA